MLGVGNGVFLKVQRLFSLCVAALGVLVQNADSARWWQVRSSETPAVQRPARQIPAPALGHCPAGETPPAEAD